MLERRVWWSIESQIGLLGTGWLIKEQEPVLEWNGGVAHWPIMFQTRQRAREEAHALQLKYAYLGWTFRVARLEVTFRA